jgi:hypothetical protein
MLWKEDLQRAVRRAKAKVIGAGRIEYAQHAKLVATALAAFGDDATATFYIEGHTAAGDFPRPDLILLHPDVGVLVIENKGVPLESIHGLENCTFRITRNGMLSEEDPVHQAERVMFALKDLCKPRFPPGEALFLRTAAFPRIRRSEVEGRFGQRLPEEILFSDACHDAAAFKSQVLSYSQRGLAFTRSGGMPKACKLTRMAHEAILTVLGGKALFHPPRPIRVAPELPDRLGVQVQHLELATREATQEQKDLGRADLRGAHRLFRGVAGSGKSIMLALSAAQTLVLNREDSGALFENNREKRVLVVCYNRSLVQYLRGKIEERFVRVAWDRPGKGELTVVHFEGLARTLAKTPALDTGLDFGQKEERARELCARIDALPPAARDAIGYEAIYVDEAQDLLPAEFEVLRRLARTDEDGRQTVVLFYDNAQNIYGVPPPTWEKLGINIVGRTVFLDTCLRNTREVLKFAFNVLVGSFAPEGQRVATRQFADVAGLRQRGLIEERDGVVEVLFSRRNGPRPVVKKFPSRRAEADWVLGELRRLFTRESVLPSDVLLLYKSDLLYRDLLAEQVAAALPAGYRLRQVDRAHRANKGLPLMEEGHLTMSTIASAKGYDAPVVFLLGIDDLPADPQGRASFYVGATRAKLMLYASGVDREGAGLMAEAWAAGERSASAVAEAEVEPAAPGRIDEPSRVAEAAVPGKKTVAAAPICEHCGSTKLHCQQGRSGYYFVCITCTKTSTLSRECSRCGKLARVRARGRAFVRICAACDTSELVHTNAELSLLEE